MGGALSEQGQSVQPLERPGQIIDAIDQGLGRPEGGFWETGERHRTAPCPAPHPAIFHQRQGNVSRFSNT
jgi:hypothetical protein